MTEPAAAHKDRKRGSAVLILIQPIARADDRAIAHGPIIFGGAARAGERPGPRKVIPARATTGPVDSLVEFDPVRNCSIAIYVSGLQPNRQCPFGHCMASSPLHWSSSPRIPANNGGRAVGLAAGANGRCPGILVYECA